MPKAARYILLAAVPGLMLCLIHRDGMAFRFSWQLASIWLGGVIFIILLSGWWRRAFFALALLRTAMLPPNYEAYLGLLLIAIFLAAVEGFRRIDEDQTMNAICVAGILLLAWTLAQKFGLAQAWFGPHSTGPFNPDTGAIFLALCLPAMLRGQWFFLIPFAIFGLIVAASLTGMLAAAIGMAIFLWLSIKSRKTLAVCGLALALMFGLWAWQTGEWRQIRSDTRWLAWKHAAWSMRAEKWGRGLGSWKEVFPLLVLQEPKLGKARPHKGKLIVNGAWLHAHNEYVQAAFELGWQTLALIAAFVSVMALKICRRIAPGHAAAGMAVLAVSCFGFFPLHIAPTALLGSAWLGLWERGSTNPDHTEKSPQRPSWPCFWPDLRWSRT